MRGRLVADHQRIWAYQTISDPEHVAAAAMLRRDRIGMVLPATEAEVASRCLSDYDYRVGHRRRPGRHGGVVTAGRTAGKRDLVSEVAFLTRTLKAPTLRDAIGRLAERATAESWSHTEFLVACLQREAAARDSHGGEGRLGAARFRSGSRWKSSTSGRREG